MLSGFRRFRSVRVAAGIIGAVVALGAAAGPPRNAAQATAAPELRPWPATPPLKVRQMLGVRTPMRDGVHLVSDIWLPPGEGRYPVVLIRTPYERSGDFYVPDRILKLAQAWVAHGIGVVNQDVRGRGDSEGEFAFFFNEAKDGYDTIEWIARQPWSNGQVAMTDGSYKGTVQWLAARERPPHLTCLFSQAAWADPFYELPFMGGAFQPGFADWVVRTSGRTSHNVVADSRMDLEATLRHRPLMTADVVRFGRELPMVRDILRHPTLDNWWRPITFMPADFRTIDVPAFHVTGWYDDDQVGAMVYWQGMQEQSPAARKQFLVIGPWTHGETRTGGSRFLEQLDRGEHSVMDIDGLSLEWFKRCFAGTTESFDWPRARVFLTGTNQWLDLEEYPLRSAVVRKLYLRSDGQANASKGGLGGLDWMAPRREPFDAYAFDPTQVAFMPDPANLDLRLGRYRDPSALAPRDDMLVYTSAPMVDALSVLGPVKLVLYASTSARDTDFVADLYDVGPDGRDIRVVYRTAILRTRYREGYDRQVPMQPDVSERLELKFFHVGHVFRPGHRIRIEISSSAPGISPNQNTGNDVGTDTQWTVARQRIFHDATRPSHLELPTVDATSLRPTATLNEAPEARR